MVQLYKEDWTILRMLGCRAVVLPSTEQIVANVLFQIVTLLFNNTLETTELNINETKPEVKSVSKLRLPGHRSDVRTVCFSSDNTAMLSASGDTVKIWNRLFLNH